MKIIYPPLVEQSYAEMKRRGITASKEAVYRQMVKSNLIDANGNPTQWAVEQGYIDSYTRQPNGDIEPKNLSAFKALHPIYAGYEDRHFSHTKAGWAVDKFIIKDLANKALADPDSTDEQRQFAYKMLDEVSHWGADNEDAE